MKAALSLTIIKKPEHETASDIYVHPGYFNTDVFIFNHAGLYTGNKTDLYSSCTWLQFLMDWWLS
jgi:hypothetical protein